MGNIARDTPRVQYFQQCMSVTGALTGLLYAVSACVAM